MSHRLRSIRWPYRSTVMLAVACPSTRWTTFTSLAAIHTLARVRHAAVGHEASEAARDIRRWVGVRSV